MKNNNNDHSEKPTCDDPSCNCHILEQPHVKDWFKANWNSLQFAMNKALKRGAILLAGKVKEYHEAGGSMATPDKDILKQEFITIFEEELKSKSLVLPEEVVEMLMERFCVDVLQFYTQTARTVTRQQNRPANQEMPEKLKDPLWKEFNDKPTQRE